MTSCSDNPSEILKRGYGKKCRLSLDDFYFRTVENGIKVAKRGLLTAFCVMGSKSDSEIPIGCHVYDSNMIEDHMLVVNVVREILKEAKPLRIKFHLAVSDQAKHFLAALKKLANEIEWINCAAGSYWLTTKHFANGNSLNSTRNFHLLMNPESQLNIKSVVPQLVQRSGLSDRDLQIVLMGLSELKKCSFLAPGTLR